jgi:hypothetical protein
MKIITKIGTTVAVIAAIAATAGCASVVESSAYRFELAELSASTDTGTTLTVRMLDISTGQPVTNAEVFAVHAKRAPFYKTVPQIRRERIALTSDGQGNYLYQSTALRAGETVRLNARIPGSSALIVGTVRTGGANPSTS